MLNFTREQRGQAFDALPRDIKGALTSDMLAETIRTIGAQHKLSIDKVGILADITALTILNLIPRESLVSKIGEELGTDPQESSLLAQTINDEVFLKIREILRQEQEASQSVQEEEGPAAQPEIRKEDILAEIENPTPVQHPISAAQDAELPAIPRPQEIITAPAPAVKEAAAKDFIASKLSATMSGSSEQSTANPDKLAQKPKYEADPYREPIS